VGGATDAGNNYPGDETGTAITLDGSGNAYITGITRSNNYPTVNPIQASYGGGFEDSFVAELNPSGSALLFSTYLGGSGRDQASGIGVNNGNIFVGGSTNSSNFPVASALLSTNQGQYDVFVTRINP
jgi:hypothetical protein